MCRTEVLIIKRYRSRKKTMPIWKEHIDYKWVNEKVNGHGALYSFDTMHGVMVIGWIYGKNPIQIFWYNFILRTKYLMRWWRKRHILSLSRAQNMGYNRRKDRI